MMEESHRQPETSMTSGTNPTSLTCLFSSIDIITLALKKSISSTKMRAHQNLNHRVENNRNWRLCRMADGVKGIQPTSSTNQKQSNKHKGQLKHSCQTIILRWNKLHRWRMLMPRTGIHRQTKPYSASIAYNYKTIPSREILEHMKTKCKNSKQLVLMDRSHLNMGMFKLHTCTNQIASQPIERSDRMGHTEIPIMNPITQTWMRRLKQTDKEQVRPIDRRGSRTASDMSQTKFKSKGAETWTIAEQ
jgi:hypothetical protein